MHAERERGGTVRNNSTSDWPSGMGNEALANSPRAALFSIAARMTLSKIFTRVRCVGSAFLDRHPRRETPESGLM